MARIAIVVGCSGYALPGNDLPAAGHDARAMSELLRQTHAYDDVLTLVDNQPAAAVKEALSAFVQKHQKLPVDEVFFYFSGHGLYRENEFYYLLNDYDDLRPRETALENAELDQLLRSLKPALAVKVVDACNSGVSYIKSALDPTLFEKHIDDTQQRFEKCYFLFSSSRDQLSYADQHLSYFTRALLRALDARPVGSVRYKDLINAIADSFDGAVAQRPFFVTQADQTEVFCALTVALKTLVARVLLDPTASLDVQPHDIVTTVVAAAKRDAERFVTEEEAFERLGELREAALAVAIPHSLSELYAFECVVGSGTPQHPGVVEVGDWLHYFGTDVLAKPTFKMMSQAMTAIETLQGVVPRKYQSTDVAGYEHTVAVPFGWLELKLKPLLLNLHPFKLLIVPLLSRCDVRLFTGICEFQYRTWTSTKLITTPKWNDKKVPLTRDAVGMAFTQELSKFWGAVAKHVTTVVEMKRDDAEEFQRRVRESG